MAKRAYELGKRCRCDDQEACDHHWWIRVFARGTRQRIDLTASYALPVPMTREDIEVWAAKAKHEARKGFIVNGRRPTAPGDTRPTLGYVADRYVEARGGGKQYYLAGLRATAVPSAHGTPVRLEDKPIDEVTTADIKHVVKVWKDRKKTLAGAKKGAVAERHLKQSARHLFNWAIEEGYATRTPFLSPQGVSLIHIKTTKGRTRRLEEGEEQRILDAADPYIKDFFVAMIETGCRPGELRTLQWSEVREDHFIVLAEKAKDREERPIAIEPTLAKMLARRKLGPDGNELTPDSFVFGDDTGKPLGRARVCGLWRAVCTRANVKNLHLHDLRGEFASQLAEAKVPIHQVRDALGHSSTTMTSTYLRSRTTGVRAAYQRRTAHRARQGMKRVV